MTTRWMKRLLPAVTLMAIALCGGCDDDDSCTCTLTMPEGDPEVATVTGTVGADGGVVILDDAISLGIPAGALAADTEFTITSDPATAFEQADHRRPESPVYTVTPRGAGVADPLQVTVHYDPTTLETNYPAALRLYADSGKGWQELETTLNGDLGLAQALIDTVSDIVLTAPNPGEGVYVEYGTVLSYIFDTSGYFRHDQVYARFDVACADEPQQPLLASTVYGSGAGWTEQLLSTGLDFQFYSSASFLTIGGAYHLNVNSSASVPTAYLEGHVTDRQVFVTAPAFEGDVSRDGFTVTWSGTDAGGEVTLCLDQFGSRFAEVTVANTGSYTFTTDQLAAIDNGVVLLVGIWQKSTPVFHLGYDPRSRCLQSCVSYIDINLVD